MNGVKRAIDGKHLAFMPLEPMARTQPKAIDSLALGDLLVMVSDAIFSHLSCHLCNANQHFQRKNSRKEYVSTYAIPFLFFFFFLPISAICFPCVQGNTFSGIFLPKVQGRSEDNNDIIVFSILQGQFYSYMYIRNRTLSSRYMGNKATPQVISALCVSTDKLKTLNVSVT